MPLAAATQGSPGTVHSGTLAQTGANVLSHLQLWFAKQGGPPAWASAVASATFVAGAGDALGCCAGGDAAKYPKHGHGQQPVLHFMS